ncbi:MAG: alpha/beta hydrolase [Pseudomonadales bacterium]|nr:alpha/beta hydrolase [Pseudomonadales bacterium]
MIADSNNLSRYVSSYLGSLKTHTAEINGQQWKYLDGGKGETIIFLHGLMGSKILWRSMMQHYVGQYRVIAVDVPGLCVNQQLSKKKHNFKELANWLTLLLEQLQIGKVQLLAHSCGCSIATYFASTYPSRVTHVTLLNHPDVSVNGNIFLAQESVEIYLKQARLDDIDGWKELVSNTFYTAPSIPSIILRHRLRSYIKHHDELINVVREFSEHKPMGMSNLRKIRCPLLIICSTHDYFSPLSFIQKLMDQLPLAQHVLIENCGHWSFVEKNSTVLNAHSDFLSASV